MSIYKNFLKEHPGLMQKEELTEEEEVLAKKYWTNCISHVGLFFKWINEFASCNTSNERLEEIIVKMSEFIDETKVRPMLNSPELSDFYKSLIVKQQQGIIYITINDFLNYFGINCDLRPKKLIEKFGGDLS